MGALTTISSLGSSVQSLASTASAINGNVIVSTPITSKQLGLNSPLPGHTPAIFKHVQNFFFILKNGIDGSVIQLTLNINPEDFVLDDPYRVSAIQTAGGAFIDIWGMGIRRLVLKGTTGWHTQTLNTQNSQTQDGFDNFFNLKEQIIAKYFSIRDSLISTVSSSVINDKIDLRIVDLLHNDAYRVVPEYFRMFRNKSRPFLISYEASFIVLRDNDEDAKDALSGLVTTSIQSISNQLSDLQGSIQKLLNQASIVAFDVALAAATLNMLNAGNGLISNMLLVLGGLVYVGEGIETISNLAQSVSSAIASGLRDLEITFTADGIPADAQLFLWEVKNVFSQIACLLEHISSNNITTYTGIISSSNCSASYGLPTSNLDSSNNSFDSINTLSNGSNYSVNNAISSSALTLVNKINSSDVPLSLA